MTVPREGSTLPRAPRSTRRTMLTGAGSAFAAPALAQATGRSGFPNRPIRVIAVWAPGPNVYTRVLGDIAGRQLGQPVVVEHRPGAQGTLGARLLLTERPDGYTLSQMPGSAIRVPYMSARPPYDPVEDFTWIICLTGYTFGVVVRADSPFRDWADFVAAAKRKPGSVSYGSPGIGTESQIVMEQIARKEGAEWLHAPFRGGSELTNALLAGQIDSVVTASHWSQLVLGGRLRLLCVWTAERLRRYPDAPTLKELGYDIVATSPYGLAGPKGMDPEVVTVLHDAFKRALHSPESLAYLERLDQPVIHMDPPTYTDFVRRQAAEERDNVRRFGLQLD